MKNVLKSLHNIVSDGFAEFGEIILFLKDRKKYLSQEQKILTLTHAGLTVLQAKVYLALVVNGRQTVKTLAEIAKIDRSNAYKEILKLQKIGLVIKKIDIPNLYEALPLECTISHLLACKKEEYETTKKEAEDLLKESEDSADSLKESIEADFFVIPKKCGFKTKSLDNIKKAQVSNDTISCLKRLSQALPESFENQMAALRNGVKIRMIVDEPQNRKSFSKLIRNLLEHPNFELRYTLMPPRVLGVCFDNKTVNILIDPSADIWDSAVFVTTHLSFVTLFQNYFNTLWESAIPIHRTKLTNPSKLVEPKILPLT